jgi:hypothetical protein
MAYIEYTLQFNIDNLDLNRLVRFFLSDSLAKNIFAPFNGRVYQDVYEVVWSQNGVLYSSIFGGFNVSYPVGNSMSGTATGYLESYWSGSVWVPYFLVQDISVPAQSILQAALTPSKLDDIALFAAAMAGNDTVVLSPFADFVRTYGGDDVIWPKGGNDWIDGGPGFDTVVISDFLFNSTWKLVDGNLVINSADGSDTLISIERIQFNDWTADGSLKDSAAAILQIWQFLSGSTPDEASFNSAFRLLAGMNGMMGTANGWNGYATSLADSNFAPEFTTNYKNLDVNSFINAVTTEVFGHAVNTEAVRNSFEIYKNYFAGQFAATDPTGEIRAKGYFIGDMLHQASDINYGKYNAAAEVFLVGLANSSAQYGQDLFFA